MKIGVSDPAEFKRLLEALVYELIDAQEHFYVHQGLAAAVSEYGAELNQSGAFWNLTMRAHLDAVLMRLCKAYDLSDGKPGLNLRNFLETIEANLHFFDEPNFRERLKNNPFVDSLAKDCKKPDPARLQKDLESVSTAEPLVKKLTIWRNNYIAHHSQSALTLGEFTKQYPLSFVEIESLISNGIGIVNDYSHLFQASHYTNYKPTDYKFILEALRRDLQAREARIQKEWAAIRAAGGQGGN